MNDERTSPDRDPLDDPRLARAVDAYRDATPGPPDRLAHGIRTALGGGDPRPAAPGGPVVVDSNRSPSTTAESGSVRRRTRLYVAAAAAVVLIAVAGWWALRPGSTDSELTAALDRVDRTQRDYVAAIAELDRRANEVLVRLERPDTPEPERLRLDSYRRRLSHLDSVIAEIDAHLRNHPGDSAGHAVLLAAYRDKDELLREVIASGEKS